MMSRIVAFRRHWHVVAGGARLVIDTGITLGATETRIPEKGLAP